MSDNIYRSRLGIDIDNDTRRKLDKLIAWGQLKPLITAVVQDLLDFLDDLEPKEREMAKALIIGRRISLMERYKEELNNGNN